MEKIADIKKTYHWLGTKGYGNGFHAKNHLQFLKLLKINSILDVGTGAGQFCDWAKTELCDTVYGLDISINPKLEFEKKDIKFLKGVSHDIPLPDKSVDMTTSFDFLEHVHPDFIDKTISEMIRVTRKCMFHTVNTKPSTSRRKQVGELHLIQENKKTWWIPKFESLLNKPKQRDVANVPGGILVIL